MPVNLNGGTGGSGGGDHPDSDHAGLLPVARVVNVVATAGAAQTLPSNQDSDLTASAASSTLTFPAVSGAGERLEFELTLRQDATGGRAWVFPAAVQWPGAGIPQLSTVASSKDVLTFRSSNGGPWEGYLAGLALGVAAVPDAPTITATAGDGQVVLTWTVPNSHGSPLTGYKLYRGTVSGTLTLITSPGTDVLTYTDTGRTNGIAYYYAIKATNAVGDSAMSAEDDATPVGTGGASVSDTFTRADTSAGLGTADSGHVWSTPVGSNTPMGIASNQAKGTSAVQRNRQLVDPAVANGTISVLVPVLGTNVGIDFRYTDESNYWTLAITGGHLYKVVAGAVTDMNPGGGVFTATAGDTFSVVLSGSSIIVKKNGTNVVNITDAFNSTATKIGLDFFQDTTGRADTFTFTP